MGGHMRPRTSWAKSFWRLASNFLWPPRSLISGERGEGAGPVSPAEFSQLTFISPPICDACGLPMPLDLGPEARCAPCVARPPRWQRARAALVYDEIARRPVLDLKRSGRRDGLATLAGWMVLAGGELLEDADLLVPVPLHYTRLVVRSFNQAVWLAAAISRRSGVPAIPDLLIRRRRTPTQAGLSGRGRRRNVAGAFVVRRSRIAAVKGRRIVLIDDVLTSGATASACVRALIAAGASAVDVLVLARVVRETDVTI